MVQTRYADVNCHGMSLDQFACSLNLHITSLAFSLSFLYNFVNQLLCLDILRAALVLARSEQYSRESASTSRYHDT